MLLIVNLVLDFRFWIKSQTHGLESLKKLLLYYSLLLLNQQILFCTLKFLHVIMAHRQFVAEWVIFWKLLFEVCVHGNPYCLLYELKLFEYCHWTGVNVTWSHMIKRRHYF